MIGIRRGASRPLFTLAALAGLLLAGCAEQQRSATPTGRVFAADLAGGAKKCTAPTPDLSAGQTSTVAMNVGNDGGWCGVTVQNRGRPFDTGLLSARPENGKVLVRRVGDITRIDYTPNSRFAGTDSFAVKLIPGDSVVKVNVTVTAP